MAPVMEVTGLDTTSPKMVGSSLRGSASVRQAWPDSHPDGDDLTLNDLRSGETGVNTAVRSLQQAIAMLPFPLIHLASLGLAAGALAGQGHTDSGIPFGLYGMDGRELVAPYTSAMEVAQPQSILEDLAAAKARGARIVVNFAGGGAKYTDSGKRLALDLWKARLDRFKPMAAQINAYVADGTLLAIMILDEPDNKQRWGGEQVPAATLDEMAAYSKTIFPDLLTATRAAPNQLQHYQWRHLDVAWAQYTAKRGAVDRYVSSQAALAQSEGLGLIVGLNITKGGDGSSGFGGAGESSMSGAEILRYGHALLESPYACAFISWDSRPRVIGRPDVASALRELAAAAQAHPATSCRQGSTLARADASAPGSFLNRYEPAHPATCGRRAST